MNKDYTMYARRELALEAAYHAATTEDEKTEIRKQHNALIAEMQDTDEGFQKISKQYYEAQQRGNELIDINDCLWDKDVSPMIARFREYGIKQFTFSSTWSSTVETAWLFVQNGCKLEGMTEIYGTCQAFMSDEYERVPAYVFSIT